LRKAHKYLTDRGVPFATNQVQYSLLSRTAEFSKVIETAEELGMNCIYDYFDSLLLKCIHITLVTSNLFTLFCLFNNNIQHHHSTSSSNIIIQHHPTSGVTTIVYSPLGQGLLSGS